jgi:hypothetical protein
MQSGASFRLWGNETRGTQELLRKGTKGRTGNSNKNKDNKESRSIVNRKKVSSFSSSNGMNSNEIEYCGME